MGVARQPTMTLADRKRTRTTALPRASFCSAIAVVLPPTGGENFASLFFRPNYGHCNSTTDAVLFDPTSASYPKGETWYVQAAHVTPKFPLGVSNVGSVSLQEREGW